MNKPFHSASADPQRVCFVYRGKGKGPTYRHVFLGGEEPTIRPWRIRTNSAAEALRPASITQWARWKVSNSAGFTSPMHLLRDIRKRRGGWLGKHFPSSPVVGPIGYSLNQSTARGCKSGQIWHHCTKAEPQCSAVFRWALARVGGE